MKIENIHYSNRPHVGHLTKGYCLGASYTKSAPCLVWCWYIFCWYILFVTWLHKTTPLRCHAYSWLRAPRSMSRPLKSLVTRGILIVRGKMLYQKRGSYKYVLPLKIWIDCTTTRQEKNVITSNMYVLTRSAQKFKKHIFPLMTIFCDYKKHDKSSLETWNVNDVIVYVWLFILR